MTYPTTSDPEKGNDSTNPTQVVDGERTDVIEQQAGTVKHLKTLAKWNEKIENLAGLESRGITRVLPSERQAKSNAAYVQVFLIWFSSNISANNLAVGLLGPLLFGLGFTDSALCAVFGCLVGSMATAYMSTWGPASGNRTLVVARYFMGYHLSKICCLLNIVIMTGWGMVDCVISGMILSAVSDNTMSVVVGIVITALISWAVAAFGLKIFHHYERWAYLPQLVVLFVLVGSAGSKFDTSTPSVGDSIEIAANRLSFFSICLSTPIAWAGSASDFFVYYPEKTPKWIMFTMTLLGLMASMSFVFLIGIGLGTGVPNSTTWTDAYDISSGALMLAGYDGLGGFGKFCGVILALGPVANNIPGTYTAALNFQVLGGFFTRVPRYALTTLVAVVYLVCGVAGRQYLFQIFENFIPLMGYWVGSFVIIVLEEQLIFRRSSPLNGFDWSTWNDKEKLPIGFAALIAFLTGWAGAIIGMSQVYYIGPIAAMIGPLGADIGFWLAAGFTAVVFPPLRFLELKKFGR